MSELTLNEIGQSDNTKKSLVDYATMVPVLGILMAICTWLLIDLEKSSAAIKSVLVWIEYELGWLFLIAIICASVFSLWLAFGRFGQVKLCAPDESADFSMFSWFCMIFMTSMASSIMIWGFIEPASYFSSPPFGLEAFSPAAYEWSLTQTMFHWSPIAYSVYVPFSVVLAYFIHVRKQDNFKVSQACSGIIGEKNANGILGKLIDIIVLFGVIGGMSTSFGLAVPVVLEGVAKMTGLDSSSLLVMGCLMLAWIVVFGVSLYRGLDRGIKVLSNFNVVIGIIFVVGVFLLSDSVFALKMGVNSMGQMLQNIFKLSTSMDPIAKTGFVESWTVFYWAWYVAFAAAVGLFIARISKGRTIREVVFGSTLAISLGVYILQITFGSLTIDLQSSGTLDIANLMSTIGSSATVLSIIESLPLGGFMVALHTLLLFTFVATSLDSTAFTCASLASVEIRGDEEPASLNKTIWAVVLLSLTAILTMIGGLSAVQVSSLVVSVPLLAIILLLSMALVKMLNEDFPSKEEKFLYAERLSLKGN